MVVSKTTVINTIKFIIITLRASTLRRVAKKATTYIKNGREGKSSLYKNYYGQRIICLRA